LLPSKELGDGPVAMWAAAMTAVSRSVSLQRRGHIQQLGSLGQHRLDLISIAMAGDDEFADLVGSGGLGVHDFTSNVRQVPNS
jgi:hypothetical protein